MVEVLPVVFLVAFGVLLLLLTLLVIFSHLRRLRTARELLGRQWATGTAALQEIVNARGRRRDEQGTAGRPRARPGNGRSRAA